jgi:hypothetical protein
MNTNKPIDLHNVSILGQSADNIIFFASIILPFINETAIILTKSGYSAFQNLYKVCVHDDVFTLLSAKCKANKNIHCSNSDTFRRLFIDALAYLGIILNIGRNTIKHGYVTGVVNGFVLVICSIVFPNLYLGEIISTLKHIFHVNKPIMNIIIGLICIIVLIFATKMLQDLSTTMFQNYRIDKINEPVVKNQTEQAIINYLE